MLHPVIVLRLGYYKHNIVSTTIRQYDRVVGCDQGNVAVLFKTP